jgi:hypothetical protein
MNEMYGYFVDRYWIIEYIEYLQDWGAILECSPQAEDSPPPKAMASHQSGIASYDCATLLKEDQGMYSKWLSYNQLFSTERSDVLQLTMRWIGPIC